MREKGEQRPAPLAHCYKPSYLSHWQLASRNHLQLLPKRCEEREPRQNINSRLRAQSVRCERESRRNSPLVGLSRFHLRISRPFVLSVIISRPISARPASAIREQLKRRLNSILLRNAQLKREKVKKRLRLGSRLVFSTDSLGVSFFLLSSLARHVRERERLSRLTAAAREGAGAHAS